MNAYPQYRHFTIGACVLSLVALTPIADAGSRQSRFMEYFDSNQDNIVTMSELNEASKQRFAKMDADANGVVSLEEFQAYLGERKALWRERRFNEMDGNGDKQISKQEYILYKQQKAEQRYQAMDVDKDGIVSKEEFLNLKSGRHSHSVKSKHRHHRGAERFFSRLDSNNDAQLNQDETLDAWTKWFKRIDANNDQVVTEDEVKAFRNNMWRK